MPSMHCTRHTVKAAGQPKPSQHVLCVFPYRLLAEGGALALGAAAGATSAAAVEALRLCSNSNTTSSSQYPPQGHKEGGKSGKSLKHIVQSVANALVAVGSPRLGGDGVAARRVSDSERRRSATGEAWVFPPVPMHPAEKVLSMQVRATRESVSCLWVGGWDKNVAVGTLGASGGRRWCTVWLGGGRKMAGLVASRMTFSSQLAVSIRPIECCQRWGSACARILPQPLVVISFCQGQLVSDKEVQRGRPGCRHQAVPDSLAS